MVPTRIEAVLLKHPHIVEAAVIGVPDDLAGERPHAFIVLADESTFCLAQDDMREHIEEYIRERLQESHWLYRRITFLPALPKTQSGKVVKRLLTAATAA